MEDVSPPIQDRSDLIEPILEGKSAKSLEHPGGASHRSGASSRSSSGGSCTSTVMYSQEPYDRFSQRVEKLCQFLWPPPTTIKHCFMNSQAATRLRRIKIIRPFVPSQQAIAIERLPGGDNNRITGITLPSSYGSDHSRFILRTRRYDQEATRPDREVAMLEYLRQQTSIPVPKIAAKDFSFSCKNLLERPYVLQHRISGTDLNLIWDTLNHPQRCTVAREIGRVVRILLSIESSVTGILEASAEGDNSLYPNIIPFELRESNGTLIEEQEPENAINDGIPRAPQSTLDFFESQLQRWRAVALAENLGEIDHLVELYDRLRTAVFEMDRLGLFPDKNCLCHVDLHPRNVMVDIKSDDSLKVTAIIDWDEAVFAPTFVNCQPPRWLWDTGKDHLDDEELDPWPYELGGANQLPATEEQQELKRIFEDSAGPEYSQLAYSDHSRYSRGLFRVATLGFNDNETYKAAERILREWNLLRQSLDEPALVELSKNLSGRSI